MVTLKGTLLISAPVALTGTTTEEPEAAPLILVLSFDWSTVTVVASPAFVSVPMFTVLPSTMTGAAAGEDELPPPEDGW